MRSTPALALGLALTVAGTAAPAAAASFFFSTGSPDGLLAAGARLPGHGLIEVETADDFVLSRTTRLTSATFTGLLPTGATAASIQQVNIEIYRVFPKDSDTGRTPNVPTRNNSPSDVDFVDRDSVAGTLSFTTSTVGSFTAGNSVLNGIHPLPGVFTGGEGAVSGVETQFDINFTTPLLLTPDHYFFRPSVLLSDGSFFWLSAPKPIVAPGTPFLPDLQAWIRDENLAPDWLRIGTDITHSGPFNMAFSLKGSIVPEPAAWVMLIAGMGLVGGALRRRRAAAI